MNANDKRKYDVIVWGASGFTGKLVTEHLLDKYGTDGDLRWAIAGRNRAKLDDGLPIIIADAHDAESMQQLARDTRVVLTTVGPYAKHGTPLVEACATNGTDYCDLTGEVQWMRAMIDRFQSEAEESGARIVHCCGFDSIPADIGVWFLQREARRRHGEPCKEIKLFVTAARGGASGGTVASILNIFEEARGAARPPRSPDPGRSIQPEPGGQTQRTLYQGPTRRRVRYHCRWLDRALRHGSRGYPNRTPNKCAA
jgi:short subunit dehydrogenase-like uncharacterized protein